MIDVGTLPELRESILYHMEAWRHPGTVHQHQADQNYATLDLQGDCGWQSFLEGFVTKDWADSQSSYYCTIQASRTGKRWLIELIKKLWATAWDQWEHRNAVLHEGENLVQLEELDRLNANITQAYHEYKLFLPTTDQHFFCNPLELILKQGHRVKEAWLKQVTAAKERAFRRHMQWFSSGREGVEAQRLSLSRMQHHMRQWLSQAR